MRGLLALPLVVLLASAAATLRSRQPEEEAAGADPTCSHGIVSRRACCPLTCGRCGGPDCGTLPGGSASCCAGSIAKTNRSCGECDAPCMIPPSPSPGPSPSPPPSPAPSPTPPDVPVLTLQLGPSAERAFPPGRRFAPSEFWAASPMLPLTAASPHLRPAADLVASGESAMLAWTPPPGATLTVPLSESHSLVRLLSGQGRPDVVVRGNATAQAPRGALVTRWASLWQRLDPWVNNSVPLPIVVLDNVPYAFCASPERCGVPTGQYGQNYGPGNVTEYGEWVETLLRAMAQRYGTERASTFWFRVGTEPNTPGHWNDTNAKYVAMYAAVAGAVDRALPGAKVGLANMGLDGDEAGFTGDVMPIARGVAASGARVDFLAMSCYGRGKGCSAHEHTECRYSIGTAALCDTRLHAIRAASPRWANVPAQVMEYGLQQNELNKVDDDPGAFGAAWTLSTSVAHATGGGVERGFHWGLGFDGFAHDGGLCAPSVSPSKCNLYRGSAWVQAQAGHLFGRDALNNTVVALRAASPGSNSTTHRPPTFLSAPPPASMSVSAGTAREAGKAGKAGGVSGAAGAATTAATASATAARPPPPATMRAVHVKGHCTAASKFSCVGSSAGVGQVLLAVGGSSVNPCDR